MRAPSSYRALALLAALLFLVSLTPAEAGKKKKKKKKKDTEVVDISAWKDQFMMYTDGDGGYYALVPGDSDSVFFGDGKTMYKQRSFGMSRNPPKWDFRMWSPRVNHVADLAGSDDAADKAGSISCGDDEFELTRVDDTEAKKIIAKAEWKPPLWKRQAHALTRDDRGNYFYIDRLRDEYGGKGYRLFSGPKGGMKELPLTNIVSDSEGQIFSSKRGELRYVSDGHSGKATWIKGEKRTELVYIPVEDNLAMVYAELGVYEGTLGTPCDEY